MPIFFHDFNRLQQDDSFRRTDNHHWRSGKTGDRAYLLGRQRTGKLATIERRP
jgi:hypothetical protein